jgi:hypothetical protein
VLRATLNELLLFISYATLNNPTIQDLFQYRADDGAAPPLQHRLISALPLSYFGVAAHIALPTFLCMCHHHPRNWGSLAQEIDLSSVATFVHSEMNARPAAKRLARQQSVGGGGAPGTPGNSSIFGASSAAGVAATAAAGGLAMLGVSPTIGPSSGSFAAGGAAGTPSLSAVMAMNWADIQDDEEMDDDFVMESESHRSQKSREALSSSIAVAGSRLARLAALHHFRLDRRYPMLLWPEALTELAGLGAAVPAGGTPK